MKWEPFCECGNRKGVGKATCVSCKKQRKALQKGNVRRFEAIAQDTGGGSVTVVIDQKTYRKIGTAMLVEVVTEKAPEAIPYADIHGPAEEPMPWLS